MQAVGLRVHRDPFGSVDDGEERSQSLFRVNHAASLVDWK